MQWFRIQRVSEAACDFGRLIPSLEISDCTTYEFDLARLLFMLCGFRFEKLDPQ
jgi:hypothetical protein